jgi:predicted protein tyrosine phosphatase
VSTIAPFDIDVCGLDELPGHRATGFTHVLSILDPAWPEPKVFGTFGEHTRLELHFDDVIDEVPGMVAPRPEHVAQVLAFGRTLQAERNGRAHLLVHCHAGVSRSTASMALILAQALPALPATAILREVLRIRPQAWPNLRLIEIGDALLERHGEIVAATHVAYATQLERRPDQAEELLRAGRGREVAAALGRKAA